ncbi:hypothetical protein KC347_g203 [Hortaea werneckii]|nr:hypothetical protein KC347_g203 [Hortaea werneckii]
MCGGGGETDACVATSIRNPHADRETLLQLFSRSGLLSSRHSLQFFLRYHSPSLLRHSYPQRYDTLRLQARDEIKRTVSAIDSGAAQEGITKQKSHRQKIEVCRI